MFDLSAFYADQSPVEWVIAGLDYREENRWFGVHNENQAIAQWRYENGVYGHATTGRSRDALGAQVRLVGDEGTIEVDAEDGPPLRIRTGRTLGWKTVEVGANIWGKRTYATRLGLLRYAIEEARGRLPGLGESAEYPSNIDRSIESVVTAVREDGESPLTWRNAIESTEVIFAAWESARRGARVDLPLEVDDNPLEAMVENGDLPVSSASEESKGAAQSDERTGAEADPGSAPDGRRDGANPRDGVGTEPGVD
jgi:predicted dehydrogenase